jgi:uridine phosphorylase
LKSKNKREFYTHTGTLRGERITVMSTGIGTENIDIVMNELDALVNIDLDKKNSKRTYCFTIVQIRNLWKCKS